MPTVRLEEAALVLQLSSLECLGALHGSSTLPLADIDSVSVSLHPWKERPWRGVRVGTGCPYLILLGRSGCSVFRLCRSLWMQDAARALKARG